MLSSAGSPSASSSASSATDSRTSGGSVPARPTYASPASVSATRISAMRARLPRPGTVPAVADAPDLDLLAASLRADATDTAAFLGALAARLEGAFPGQVEVQRKGGIFGG